MPTGLVMRVIGRDPMTRKFDANAKTYRVNRVPRPGSHKSHLTTVVEGAASIFK